MADIETATRQEIEFAFVRALRDHYGGEFPEENTFSWGPTDVTEGGVRLTCRFTFRNYSYVYESRAATMELACENIVYSIGSDFRSTIRGFDNQADFFRNAHSNLLENRAHRDLIAAVESLAVMCDDIGCHKLATKVTFPKYHVYSDTPGKFQCADHAPDYVSEINEEEVRPTVLYHEQHPLVLKYWGEVVALHGKEWE